MSRIAWAIGVPVAAFLLGLGAGASQPPPPPDPLADPDDRALALELAVDRYARAYFAGDFPEAYRDTWSQRCIEQTRHWEVRKVMALQKALNLAGRKATVEGVEVDRISGDIGLVSYSYTSEDQTFEVRSQAWVYEERAWHYDAC